MRPQVLDTRGELLVRHPLIIELFLKCHDLRCQTCNLFRVGRRCPRIQNIYTLAYPFQRSCYPALKLLDIRHFLAFLAVGPRSTLSPGAGESPFEDVRPKFTQPCGKMRPF